MGLDRRGAGLESLGTALRLTKRDMLERLIKAADGEIVATLDPTSPERAAYFAVTR
jgi:hypothetical protein